MATLIQRPVSRYLEGEVYPPRRAAPSRPARSCPRPTQHQAPSTKHAFTLIELLVVMAIMVIMLGLSIAAFKDIGSGAGMRGAVLQFKTNMSLARQNAITRRAKTWMWYGNESGTRGMFWMSNSLANTIGTTNYFAQGILFSNALMANVEFRIDGTSQGRDIFVSDSGFSSTTNVTIFRVYPQTGQTKVFKGKP